MNPNDHKLTIALALLSYAVVQFAPFIPHIPPGLVGAITGFMALANGVFQKNQEAPK